MVRTSIVEGPLPTHQADDSHREHGAELVFFGRVRDQEHGKPIIALEYEHYAGMAERELERLAQQTLERFAIGELHCDHRVGRVEVGHASLRVAIWSRHRQAGLEAMAWFISELKKSVPIWKWAITADGERFPSHCDHAEPSF
ncbi:MAG: molybdenum cofactor biosynthesis protein MoaE [Deltaproteobacteria bacterium]|nr:molybdenum cofactor biosynthesis protein MoaE [Deltaproteobacteria bacterium]